LSETHDPYHEHNRIIQEHITEQVLAHNQHRVRSKKHFYSDPTKTSFARHHTRI